MARRFTNGDGDTLDVAAGALAGSTRAGTVIALVKRPAGSFLTSMSIIFGRASATPVWGMFVDTLTPFADGDFGAGGADITPDNWTVIAATKPSGSAEYRYHTAEIGGAWTHQAGGFAVVDGSGGTDQVRFGDFLMNFDIAAAARWTTALSDGDIEALGTTDMADWLAGDPDAAWQFNQESTSDAVSDLTGGGADQTAITGTSVADDPPGWAYASTGPDVTLSVMAPAATSEISAVVAGDAELSATAPVPVVSINADVSEPAGAELDATAPAPVVSINAFVQQTASAVLEAAGPAARLSMSTFGNPIYEQIIAAHPYIGPLMVEALTCICEQTSRINNPPQHCCFRVGTEVIHDAGFSIDECCEGVAYVALGDIFPSSESFPEQDIVRQATSNCPPPAWGLYLKLGIIRCIPVGGQDPLGCDEWNLAALQNIYDTKALMDTACCIRDWVIRREPKFDGMSVIIDRQVQGNPLGGCVERSITMAVQIPNCEC